MEALCCTYQDVLHRELVDPLLLIPYFILDFLCIHPFNDDNGRMSRLLTLLMLYQNGYVVGQYISIEKQLQRLRMSTMQHWRRLISTGMRRKMTRHRLSNICWR